MPKVVFTFVLGYISLSHLYRAYVDYMGWSLDFTGPQVSDNRSVIHTNHTKHTNIPWYTTVSLNIITFCALLLSRLGPYDSDKVVYVKKYLIVPGIRSIVVSFRLVVIKCTSINRHNRQLSINPSLRCSIVSVVDLEAHFYHHHHHHHHLFLTNRPSLIGRRSWWCMIPLCSRTSGSFWLNIDIHTVVISRDSVVHSTRCQVQVHTYYRESLAYSSMHIHFVCSLTFFRGAFSWCLYIRIPGTINSIPGCMLLRIQCPIIYVHERFFCAIIFHPLYRQITSARSYVQMYR